MKFFGGFALGFVLAVFIDFLVYDALILSQCVVWR